MQTITPIQLDMTRPVIPAVVYAMQQDEQTRYVAIGMTEAGVAFTPPAGTLGVLAISKPDGEPCFYDSANGEPAVTIEGSTATCLLVPEALQVAGDAPAALVLYNAQGDRLSTFRFLLRIEPTPVPDETVTSSSYYSILTQQIADAIAAGELAHQVIDMTVSATTLPAGSEATVTKTEQGGVFNLAFGIPKGEAGAAGQAATVAVGTVTTLPAGSDATVTNSGTPGAAVFNFGIPQGAAGDGAIYETSALDSMEASALAALHAQGYRAIVATYNETVTMHALAADGSLAWIGCNQNTTNLLDNPDFAIAQAGYGGTHGMQVYAADRWAQSDGSATYSQASGGGLSIQMSQAGRIYQKLDEPLSGNFTLAVNVDGEDYVSAGTWPETAGINVDFPGGSAHADATLGVVIYFNASYTIAHARLLRGSYSNKTLPPWVAPDSDTELLKCKTFFNVIPTIVTLGIEGLDTTVIFNKMRIVPTATSYSRTGTIGKISVWDIPASMFKDVDATLTPGQETLRIESYHGKWYYSFLRIELSADL